VEKDRDDRGEATEGDSGEATGGDLLIYPIKSNLKPGGQ
jgi:hypothetical protein